MLKVQEQQLKKIQIAHKSENADYFYCYNARLRRFLHENGLKWINKGVHFKTQMPFWIFERSDKLDFLMKEYKR